MHTTSQNGGHHHNTRNHGTNGNHNQGQQMNGDRRDGHRNKRTNAERSCAYDNGDNAIGRSAAGAGMKRQRTDGGKNGSHSLLGASSTTGSG